MASAHTAQSLIQQISDYGTSRGEPTASEWFPDINRINGYLLAHPDQTHAVTTKLLNTLHRVQRGETVSPHEWKAGDTMPTNHDFALKRYTTASQSVARAVRDPPIHLNPFLSSEIYDNTLHFRPSNRFELETMIDEIADFFGKQGYDFRNPADTWRFTMKRHLKHSRLPARDMRLVRIKLIVVAERVRNWEPLPDPGEITELEDIRNERPEFMIKNSGDLAAYLAQHRVESHSLGRMRLRTAKRIGYNGVESREGGLQF